MSLSDPCSIGGERISRAPFNRPEVGLYLRFFRAPGRVLGGCVDILEAMNTVRGQGRFILAKILRLNRGVWLVTSRRKDAEGVISASRNSDSHRLQPARLHEDPSTAGRPGTEGIEAPPKGKLPSSSCAAYRIV